MLDQRPEAVGVFPPVNYPVAEARCVIVALPEPAVVQHEAFDTEPRGLFRLPLQHFDIVLEVAAFPCVEEHGTRPHRTARPLQHVAPDVAMEPAAELAQSSWRERCESPRRLMAFVLPEDDFSGMKKGLQPGDAPAVFQYVDPCPVIAAPAEMESEDFPVFLPEPWRPGYETGKPVMGHAATPALDRPAADRKKKTLRCELPRPQPLEGQDLPRGFGQQENSGGKTLQLQRLIREIGQAGSGGEDIAVDRQRKLDLQSKTGDAVACADEQTPLSLFNIIDREACGPVASGTMRRKCRCA